MTHIWEENYNCRGSPPKREGSEPPTGLPSPGVLHQEDEPPECLDLKAAAGLTLGRARGLWEVETPLLKDAHKIHMLQDPGQKQ